MLYTEQLVLTPTVPFDFDKSLSFLCGFEATKNEHTVDQRALTKALVIGDQAVAFRVAAGSNAAGLSCELSSHQPLSPAVVQATADRVSFFLSLGDDLSEFYAVGRQDAAFCKVVEALYGYHQVKFLTPFENACWAILAQRNPMPVAVTMKRALVEHFGNRVELDGSVYQAFPSVEQLRSLSAAELSALINNQRKAAYLEDVARSFGEVDEQFLRGAAYDVVEQWLRNIKGIGAWSASFVLIRGLGRTEVIPPDQAVISAAAKVYGRPFSPASLAEAASPYGAWQGYWGHYLRVFA